MTVADVALCAETAGVIASKSHNQPSKAGRQSPASHFMEEHTEAQRN